jgi:hypothetical protein
MKPSSFDTVSQIALSGVPQRRHALLLSLLEQLKSWIDAEVAPGTVTATIERFRASAARKPEDDPYQLHIALGTVAGRIFVVPRGVTDPVQIVDVVGPQGVAFSIHRTGPTWSLVSTTGGVGKFTASSFNAGLAGIGAALMRAP